MGPGGLEVIAKSFRDCLVAMSRKVGQDSILTENKGLWLDKGNPGEPQSGGCVRTELGPTVQACPILGS